MSRTFKFFNLAGKTIYTLGDILDLETKWDNDGVDTTLREAINAAFYHFNITFHKDDIIEYVATAIEPEYFDLTVYRFFKNCTNGVMFFVSDSLKIIPLEDYQSIYRFPNFDDLHNHNMVIMTDSDTTLFTIYITNENLNMITDIDNWVDDMAEYISKRYELVECCNTLQSKFPLDINRFIMDYEKDPTDEEVSFIQLTV